MGELDAAAFEKALALRLTGQGDKPDTHRYFIANDELIRANGKTYAVTKKMWELSTTSAIVALLNAFSGPSHFIQGKQLASRLY